MPLSTILGLLLRSLLLLQCLPFVTADQQQPLKDTGGIVARITQANWQRKLSPKLEGPEEWLLYNTGNKSCYGRCAAADEAWSVRCTTPFPCFTSHTSLSFGWLTTTPRVQA